MLRVTIESITGIRAARMEWKNYERKIICGYGYQLVGWPAHLPIANGIDNLSEPTLRDVSAKLQSRDIDWSVATKEEVENVRKALPAITTRSDKGVSRGPYHKRSRRHGCPNSKKSSNSNSSSDDSSDDDNNGEMDEYAAFGFSAL